MIAICLSVFWEVARWQWHAMTMEMYQNGLARATNDLPAAHIFPFKFVSHWFSTLDWPLDLARNTICSPPKYSNCPASGMEDLDFAWFLQYIFPKSQWIQHGLCGTKDLFSHQNSPQKTIGTSSTSKDQHGGCHPQRISLRSALRGGAAAALRWRFPDAGHAVNTWRESKGGRPRPYKNTLSIVKSFFDFCLTVWVGETHDFWWFWWF